MQITNKNSKGKWMDNYCRIPNRWIIDKNLDNYEKMILFFLEAWAFKKDQYFTHAAIIKNLGFSLNTVKDRIKNLVSKGYLEKSFYVDEMSGSIRGMYLKPIYDQEASSDIGSTHPVIENCDPVVEKCDPVVEKCDPVVEKTSQDGLHKNYLTTRTTRTTLTGVEEKAGKPAAVSKEKDSKRDQAKELITYINDYGGRKYKHTENNIGYIIPRLNEGFTVEDCKSVIRKKYHDPDFNKKYFCPETLFRPSKFEKYFNQPEERTAEEIEKSINDKLQSLIPADVLKRCAFIEERDEAARKKQEQEKLALLRA